MTTLSHEHAVRSTGARRLLVTGRFARPYRRSILALIEKSRRLEDLAHSFPALLFALASGFASAAARAHAITLVIEGAPLRSIAATLGLPWWLRRLAPEALSERLPALPSQADFDLAIANLVPADPGEVTSWLNRIAVAAVACDTEFALWMARQRRLPPGSHDPEEALLLVAAWAWHCGRRGTPGHALVRTPWTPAMSLKRATTEARAWLRRIDLAISLEHGIADEWYPAGEAGGLRFVPLSTLADFLAEAEALDNCLDQYADQIRAGGTRLFSILRDGLRVATMELCAHEDDSVVPRITQLRGPRNRRVPPEVWQAALLWLSQQRFRPLTAAAVASDRAAQTRAWRSFWRPYLEAIRDDRIRNKVDGLLPANGRAWGDGARAQPRLPGPSRQGGR